MIGFIVMVARKGKGRISEFLSEARLAAAIDAVEKAKEVGCFDPIIVATNWPEAAEAFWEMGAVVDLDQGDFHFGGRLLALVSKYKLGKVFYTGAASIPLLPPSFLAQIASFLEGDGVLVANNLFSSDWVGFSPAEALGKIVPPSSDNDLAWRLWDEAGLRPIIPPHSTATTFDIDTPSDLLILKAYPGLEGKLASFVEKLPLGAEVVWKIAEVLKDEDAFILAAGRVPSYAWERLEREALCRTRVISEERGMRSSGRLARGEVRSLLGYLVETLGPEGFFRRAAEMAKAAIIDTRVLMAHRGIWPPDEERFASDLMVPEEISDPWLRDFTRAAKEAPIPVLLGGHSLVCGGIMALVDIARHQGLKGRRTESFPWDVGSLSNPSGEDL
jgi:hypothetical protein